MKKRHVQRRSDQGRRSRQPEESQWRDAVAELELLYETSPACLGVLDTQLRYVRINSRLAELHDLPREAHLGKTVREIIPDMADVIEPLLREVIATGVPIQNRELNVRLPAHPFRDSHWLVNYAPLRENGQVCGVNVMVLDITERKLAERRTELHHKVTALLARAESFETIIPTLLQEICLTLDAQNASLWLLEPDQNTLRCARTHSADGSAAARKFASETCRHRFEREISLPGRVFNSRQATWFTNLATEQNFRRSAAARAAGLQSAMAFPISSGAEFIGVMEFFTRRCVEPDRPLLGVMALIGHEMAQFIQRRRAEDAVRAGEEHFRLIFESVKDFAIFTLDGQGRIDSWNPGAERMFGYGEAEILQQNFAILFTPEDRASGLPERELNIALDHGCAKDERWHLRKDGTRFFVSGALRPMLDAGGQVRGFAKVARDITERKKLEESLRRSAQQFRTIARVLPGVVFFARPDGSKTFICQEFYDYTGLPPGSGKGFGWIDTLHPDDRERVKAIWEEADKAGRAIETRYRCRNLTGEYRWFLMRAGAVRDAEGNLLEWLGVCMDIEEQVRASELLEARIAERTAQLQTSIAELESFSYSLSHDMRSPLRAIRSFTQLVLNESGERLTADAQDYLQKVVSAAARMDRLVQDVLTFTRISRAPIVIQPVEVEALLREIIGERPELQPPLAEVRIANPLLPMRGHEASLTQCLTNLLSNAVKYVPAGVTPQVQVGSERRGNEVRLWVQDNGIGIHPDAQSQLFTLFSRVHKGNAYEGTGIGLAIVRKAMERMGGSVGVESEPGHGSRFWFQLPAADSGSVSEEAP